MAEGFDRREFLAGYLAEVEEHLSSANAQLMKLESARTRGTPQLRMVRELFRALHTIKGLSAMVGVEPIVEIAHELEALLRAHDQAATPLVDAGVELLFRGLREIDTRVRSVAQEQRVESAPQALLTALHALHGSGTTTGDSTAGAAASALALPADLFDKLAPAEREQLTQGLASGARAVRLDFSPSPTRAAAGLTITTVRERLDARAEIVKVVPRSVPKGESAPSGLTFVLLLLTRDDPEALAREVFGDDAPTLIELATPAAPAPSADERADAEPAVATDDLHADTIRVEVSRLDDALEKLASLVVTRFRLEREVRALRERDVDVRALETLLGEHRRELSRLRGSLTRARMVSLNQLLERVPLLVRGMARDTGKQVQLRIDAGRAELDKAVAERVFPVLMHLIRNAVDHAIEPVETRRRLGKPEAGTIEVTCFERAGSQLELTIRDDGAGIDRERVAHKAGVAVPTDDRVLLALITRPGLTTRDTADARSGRGMGMDIARRVAVDMLGGELTLHTERDVGTTFKLLLPISISILESLTFRCGATRFVVPQAMVEEIVELEGAQVVSAPAPRAREGMRPARLLRRRGESIPLFALSSFLALEPAAGMRSALIVRRDGLRYAFEVDHMLGQQEVMVRPLEDPLVKVAGVTGSTDLGDGHPTLVLDLWALTRSSRRASPHASTP